MKISIVGIVGSGKTTLSKLLGETLEVTPYEYDVIVHPVVNGVRKKRTTEEQLLEVQRINRNNHWIIEGVNRKNLEFAHDLADLVVFLDPPLILRYKRLLIRYIKQKLKIEPCHYKSNIKMLKMMFQWTKTFETNRTAFELSLSKYNNVLVVKDTMTLKALETILNHIGETNEFVSNT